MELKYLVTGCGRSGTVHMARLLSSVGISCGHESIFDHTGINSALMKLRKNRDIGLSWVSARDGYGWFDPHIMEADSSYMAAPYLSHECLEKTTVIHVVRNPLLVISSFLLDVKHFQENPKVAAWDNFIEFHLPQIKNLKTPIEKACYYYVNWNFMVEPYSNVLHKIEDGAEILFNKFGIKPETYYQDKTTNTFGKRDRNILLDEIPNGKIKDDFLLMFQKYNYPIENVSFKTTMKAYI